MGDRDKTKEQLIDELEALRREVVKLRELGAQHKAERTLELSKAEVVLEKQIAERKRAELELVELHDKAQEQAKFLRLLIDTVPAIIVVKDPKGRFLLANKYKEYLQGVSEAEILGKDDYHFVPAELADRFCRAHTEVMETRQPCFYPEEPYPDCSGSTRYLDVTRVPLIGPDGRCNSILEVAVDVTQRKQAEETLRKQNEYLTALHETALALMNRLELADLLEALVTRAGALLGTMHGFIYLLESDRSGGAEESEIVLRVGVGVYSKYLGYRLKRGEGVAGIIWQTGQPLSVEDYQTWPDRVPGFSGDNFHAVVAAPLKSGSEVVGVIGLAYTEKGRTFRGDEILLMNRFAQLASIALDNARLYTSAQQELTERKRAEEALAAEKERLAVTLRSIGDGVITTDTEGKIVLINKAAEMLTGWTQDEAIGQPLPTVFYILHEKTREQCESPVEKVLQTGEVISLANHTVLIARDGTERIIADSGAPIRDKEGHVIGVVLVFRDITERQKMEEERLKASKLESLGILAGGIAHDFNNILTAVLMNISLAKMYTNPEDTAFKRLIEAEKASQRARDLTQQLLTFSKGGAPIKKTASILELIKDSAIFALRGSSVRCEFYLPEDLWPVEVDEGQMSQVIHNLVINAQQAMPRGGTIRIRAENKTARSGGGPGLPSHLERYIQLSILDEGVGISEEHLPKIFDPYFTTKQGGSGLGLATTYSIIKNHGGSIRVESKMGAGTCFYIYLPASQRQIPVQKQKAEEDFSVPSQVARGKILVMDDEEMIKEAVGQMLRGLGYDVEFARDGVEAIGLYKRSKESNEPFAAVILDLTIPGGLGGRETIQRLREIDPQVKAIVSSGYFNDPIMADFRQYGFKGVVAKPYKVEELRKVVYHVVIGIER